MPNPVCICEQDAFSKTVPIWAAVVNHAVVQLGQKLPSPANLSHTRDWDLDVHLPCWVTDSEKQQIASKLDAWVVQLLQASAHSFGRLCGKSVCRLPL